MLTFALDAVGSDSRLWRAAPTVLRLLVGTSPMAEGVEAPVRYFEVAVPCWAAVCPDNNWPWPETPILQGAGHIYISLDLVEFWRDALAGREATEKPRRIWAEGDARARRYVITDPRQIAVPAFICERGARPRHLDLEVVAAEARQWWETGRMPLRPMPEAAEGQGRG